MKEFTTRAIFGLLYAITVLAGLFFHPFGLLALMVVIFVLGLFETKHLLKQNSEKTLYVTASILGVILLWAHMSFLQVYQDFLLPLVVLLVMILMLQHLFSKGSEENNDRLPKVLFSTLYVFLPTSLAISIAFTSGGFEPRYLIALFFFLWSSDTFAYLTGIAIGKHKLIPRLSPKKSIEGLAGGFVGTLGVAYLLSLWWDILTLEQWLIFGGITALAGTVGDLFESSLKRAAGVKDSGNLIPGHGGILDRLDSFLLSVPIIYFCLRFFM